MALVETEEIPHRGRWPLLRLADGTAVGAQGLCSDMTPGDCIGVWYDDDSVWHHRTLLYPFGPNV
eukprot:7097720-Pyramimonas_sp.AAC.1